jgi:Ca2+-binding EF-hand superfamily protein
MGNLACCASSRDEKSPNILDKKKGKTPKSFKGLSKEEVNQLKLAYSHMDKDGNGNISREELSKFFKNMGGNSEAAA